MRLAQRNEPVNIRALDIFVSGLPCRSTSIEKLASKIPVSHAIEMFPIQLGLNTSKGNCSESVQGQTGRGRVAAHARVNRPKMWKKHCFSSILRYNNDKKDESWSLNYTLIFHQAIRKRKSEILVDYCYQSCPTRAPVRNVTDKFGTVIETIGEENVYSIHEARPELPPLVHRETHYLPPGSSINFTCPK